ncbi:hypothetical protein LSCM1_00553 [Leishmania martiniquensis]|uniref:Uncharacterized protein n=1 Tax=Leishmania martiniquensis TaxID=1580590 RepID=A0A836GFP8_9TRYP|nr:hypothetical protein LSCM1_00553 [Leishmania martiniquensis]
MRCEVYNAPINAIACSSTGGEVYFATGNIVYCSGTASLTGTASVQEPQAASATVRFATASPSTTISAVSVAHLSPHLPIVFMGAADHVLAQCGTVGDPSKCSCRVVLHTDEGRVLRIVVDEQRGVVHVLTDSNESFYGSLSDVAQALGAQTASGGYDVSDRCVFARIRGPRIGVVLAADCLVQDLLSPGGHKDAPTAVAGGIDYGACRCFAGTYAGDIVEWEASTPVDWASVTGTASAQSRRSHARTGTLVSRVQAHPSGCAIFSVRVKATSLVPCGAFSAESKATPLACMHLVTCSDDRSVALYERRCSTASDAAALRRSAEASEGGWVLLWRGSGTDFARSRIFDVALHPVWRARAATMPDLPRPRCSVYVGVAGEDGSVQAIEVNLSEGGNLDAEPLSKWTQSDGLRRVATRRLVRLHQHRGHGVFRVAFSAPSPESLTLISGGFDGAVFAHTLSFMLCQREDDSGGALPLQIHDVMSQRPILATAKGFNGTATEGGGKLQRHPSSSPFSQKADQVRAVHVDSDGLLLVCTSRALCVQCDCASQCSWWTPLATGALLQRGGGTWAESVVDWGAPAALESVVARCCVPSVRGSREAPVGCALVGTTTGALCAVPYSYASAELDSFRPVAAFSATHSSRPDYEGRLSTSALTPFGKITHVATLRVPEGHATDAARAFRGGNDAVAAHSTAATTSEFLVATNHVRDTIVLSRLLLTLRCACGSVAPACAGDLCVELGASAVWYTLNVYSNCPGPLTTALSLLLLFGGRYGASERDDGRDGVKDDVAMPLWLLVGDRNGRLLGKRHDVTSYPHDSVGNPLDSGALPAATSLQAVATVNCYVFAEHLRIAISAVCAENGGCATAAGGAGVPGTILITVAGTGGVLEYLYLHPAPSLGTGGAGEAAPLPPSSKEPLRLPFEVSSVLYVSPWLWVVQCGTTVSILQRVPGQASWVPVGSCDEVRAPRLLTARVVAASPHGSAIAFFAHCSDGRTVKRVTVQPGLAAMPRPAPPLRSAQTTLLHGLGFPGKDHNCVAYAPAPLHCLLIGNEDSSLALYPTRAARGPGEVPHAHSVYSGLLTPLNVCGAHHSNILAIAVLPHAEADGLRFVSVGGGAAVNLWSARLTSSPLRLLDWWCGSGSPSSRNAAALLPEGACGIATKREGVSDEPRISSACFQRRREKRAVTAPAPLTLTDRVPRFMAVTALNSAEIAVGGSDGTVLFFHVCEGGRRGRAPQPTAATLHLQWRGVLNAERAKPIMCINSVHHDGRDALGCTANVDGTPLWVLAGDTNGVVYAVDAVSHVVHSHTRVEQSCVNAISEIQRMPTVSPSHTEARMQQWRFVALHDSGVVHLVELRLSAVQDGSMQTAELLLLWSTSTGLTAGRSAHWPALSHPLVVVTEERVIEFDPEAAQRGELRHGRVQRVSVRCVSGSAVVTEGPSSRQLATGSQVAVVGQGFELIGV